MTMIRIGIFMISTCESNLPFVPENNDNLLISIVNKHIEQLNPYDAIDCIKN